MGFGRWFHRDGWRQILIGLPFGWLGLFFFLPFVIVLAMSFALRSATAPPFAFLPDLPYLSLGNYARLFEDGLYLRALLTSLANAGLATLLCLLLGFPMALALTRLSGPWRIAMLMLVILPFWTSYLLRVYAWIGLFGARSWLNQSLTALYNTLSFGPPLGHLPLMNSNAAVVVVMVYSYLPFMILPLYANLERLEAVLTEAAMDLGARPSQVFRDVTLPLSLPGIVAGGLLVFIPASGELIIPSLVGNAADPMIGRVIGDVFSVSRDWPMASAIAVALLVLMVGPVLLWSRAESRAAAGPGGKGEAGA